MGDNPYYAGKKGFKNRKSTNSKPVSIQTSTAEKRVTDTQESTLHLFRRIRVGHTNVLKVVKKLPFGSYLSSSSEKEEILLPKRFEPEDCKVGDLIKVFVYYDSEDRIIATTETPLIQVDECAYLKAVDVNKVGAFLANGLMKDLFVPFAEQDLRIKVGESYVVFCYLDDISGRIMASSKLDKFLLEESQSHSAGQAVELLVYAETELGYKAVVGSSYIGLLYKNELLAPVKIGDKLQGYIKALRDDKKLDLTLQLPSQKNRSDLANQILDYIKAQGSQSNITDSSSPETIYRQFKVSKKAYKKALGALYKRRLIVIEKDIIKLK